MSKSQVSHVSYEFTGDEENLKLSHCRVIDASLYDTSGKPINGGVYDARMGTTEYSYMCGECQHSKKMCLGHRGHLELNVFVYQPLCISEIRKWLRSICHKCSRLKVNPASYRTLTLNDVCNMSKFDNKQCIYFPECDGRYPEIEKDPSDDFTFKSKTMMPNGTQIVETLLPSNIAKIFSKVPDNEAYAITKTHPKKLLFRIMTIPPNTIRPGVKSPNLGGNTYSDMTNCIQSIIKTNMGIRKDIEFGGVIDMNTEKQMEVMNVLIYGFIKGYSATAQNKKTVVVGNIPQKSIINALPKKTGRIRNNLLKGRVFNISRSTISGNTKLKLDEVLIPVEFVKIMQVCETVQPFNRDRLMVYFLNGRQHYPGCTHVIKKSTGDIHDISGLKNYRLEYGDIIYRDVIDGDIGILNRAPSLERSSVSAMKVLINHDKSQHTFQFNVITCDLFNADFDGDQMVFFMVMTAGSIIEGKQLSYCSNMFMSTKSSGPANGQVQDSIVGSYLLSLEKNIDKKHAMAIFNKSYTNNVYFNNFPEDHIFTGRDLFSMLYTKYPFNLTRAPNCYTEEYAPFTDVTQKTKIVKGVFESGVLDKKAIGSKAMGGVNHLIGREYGSRVALDVIYRHQQMVMHALYYTGFSVGLFDLVISKEARDRIQRVVEGAEIESQLINEQLIRKEIIPPIDSTVKEFYEAQQIAAASLPDGEILTPILQEINLKTNGLHIMISCGSKGSKPNQKHIMGKIGPTVINGVRAEPNVYFQTNSLDMNARGFVASNYINGMNAKQFLFQAQHGRFDLITKALSTAVTGNFMRECEMNCDSDVIDNLRRVVKDHGVVQPIYGDDGADTRFVEKVSFRTVKLSNEKIMKEYSVKGNLVDDYLKKMISDRDDYRKTFLNVEQNNINQPFTDTIYAIMDIGKIIETNKYESPNVDIDKNIEMVNKFIDDMPYIMLNDIQRKLRTKVPPSFVHATRTMQILTRSELTPKILNTLSLTNLEAILNLIKFRYEQSLICAGAAAGILTAQALSEPFVQYMLDSHHRSVAGGTKNSVDRLFEIYGAKSIEKEQTPTMYLPILDSLLHGEHNEKMIKAQDIAKSIEQVTIGDFVLDAKSLHETFDNMRSKDFLSDRVWIDKMSEYYPLTNNQNLCNFCLRLKLDKSNMIFKFVPLDLIVNKLIIQQDLFVIATSEASKEYIIRIWPKNSYFNKKKIDEAVISAFVDEIKSIPIRGIDRIIATTVQKHKRHTVNELGELVEVDEYAVITLGTNLSEVLLHPAFKKDRIISNSIPDTAKVFGICAARNKIANEIRVFMSDNAPNWKHILLVSDEMTRTGKVTSMKRGGLKHREPKNTLLLSAFDDPVKNFVDAGLKNNMHKVHGISAYRMIGATPRAGSAYNNLYINHEFVAKNAVTIESLIDSL